MLRRLSIWAALVLALTLPTLAHARWLRAESPLFIVYSDGGESDLRKATAELEQFDAFLRMITGAPRPTSVQKLTVYLVAGQRNLRLANPYLIPAAYGFYTASSSGIAAVGVRPDQGPEMVSGRQILFHEYTHHFMQQNFPGAYPAWYHEGFAELCSTVTFVGGKVEFGRAVPNRAGWLSNHPWMPIEKLFDPPTPKVVTEEEMYYPEAWLTTNYILIVRPDFQPKLKAYIIALRQGAEPGPAFRQAFGMDFAAFQKLLSVYFAKGRTYSVFTGVKFETTSIAVTSTPPSADTLLLDHARLVAGSVKPEDYADYLAQIRSKTAPLPDDPLALRTLALAEIRMGVSAAADPPLDRLLQATPDDLEGLYLKGLRYMTAGSKGGQDTLFAKARPYLVRAYRLDPHYFPALYLLGRSLETSGRPSDNQVNALGNAYLLAPQVSEIAISAAQTLAHAERYREAADILETFAYPPHPSSETEAARKLLDDVRSHLAKPAASAAAAP